MAFLQRFLPRQPLELPRPQNAQQREAWQGKQIHQGTRFEVSVHGAHDHLYFALPLSDDLFRYCRAIKMALARGASSQNNTNTMGNQMLKWTQ